MESCLSSESSVLIPDQDCAGGASPCVTLTATPSLTVPQRRPARVPAWPFRFLLLLSLFSLSPAILAAPIFMGIGTTNDFFAANGISADGQVVIGSQRTGVGQNEAAQWTVASGFQVLGNLGIASSSATGVSANGSVVVGSSINTSGSFEAFRWTAMSGITSLGLPPASMALDISGSGTTIVGMAQNRPALVTQTNVLTLLSNDPSAGGTATGISADGQVVVGNVGNSAFRWTVAGGLQLLPYIDAPPVMADVSANGSVAVGYFLRSDTAKWTSEAFRWTESGGYQGLGRPGATDTFATVTSAEGSLILGFSTIGNQDSGFAWDSAHGLRDLADVLTGAGLALDGWQELMPTGISADGKTIVGNDTSPNGFGQAWLARLDAPLTTQRPSVPTLAALAKDVYLGDQAQGAGGFVRDPSLSGAPMDSEQMFTGTANSM